MFPIAFLGGQPTAPAHACMDEGALAGNQNWLLTDRSEEYLFDRMFVDFVSPQVNTGAVVRV
jgi:hypothetical protein